MALWNEKPTPAPAGRKEPLTPAPAGTVQPSVTPSSSERNLMERNTSEAALAAAPRRPAPRERGEGGESVIAANISILPSIDIFAAITDSPPSPRSRGAGRRGAAANAASLVLRSMRLRSDDDGVTDGWTVPAGAGVRGSFRPAGAGVGFSFQSAITHNLPH